MMPTTAARTYSGCCVANAFERLMWFSTQTSARATRNLFAAVELARPIMVSIPLWKPSFFQPCTNTDDRTGPAREPQRPRGARGDDRDGRLSSIEGAHARDVRGPRQACAPGDIRHLHSGLRTGL